jgi:hypothetical protein
MTFQAIRAAYEDHIRTAAAALTPPVPVFFENQPFTDADAAKEHILMRLDFGVIGEETIGDMVENVRGSLVVEVYTPKGRGPGRSQVVAAALAKALSAMNAQRRKAATGVRASIHRRLRANRISLRVWAAASRLPTLFRSQSPRWQYRRPRLSFF